MILRTLLASAALTLGTLLAAPAPSYAADKTVTVVDNSFTPARVTVGLDDTVTWDFQDVQVHTSTSDQGFWDSGARTSGATFAITATSAGSFAYHCERHPHMHGTVRVRLASAGSSADGWTLTWATAEAAEGRDHDVQVRRKGTETWRWFRRDTTDATGDFNPRKAGTWKIRARTSNSEDPDDVQNSGWSPVRTVKVT